MIMPDPARDGLVPEAWILVAVVSVTVNVCVLLRGIVSRAVLLARGRSRRRGSSSTLADCENAVGRRPTFEKVRRDDVLVSA